MHAARPASSRVSAGGAVRETLEWVDRWLHRYERLVAGLVLLLLGWVAMLYAVERPYWLDEYLSLMTDSARSVASMWEMQKTAPLVLDPLLYHLLVRLVFSVLGVSEGHARLVSILAYIATSGVVYGFVRRY